MVAQPFQAGVHWIRGLKPSATISRHSVTETDSKPAELIDNTTKRGTIVYCASPDAQPALCQLYLLCLLGNTVLAHPLLDYFGLPIS